MPRGATIATSARMATKTNKVNVLDRVVPAVVLWAVGKAMATPKMQELSKKADGRFNRATRAAGRNLKSNRGWVAAGVAAVAAGVGLIAAGTFKR